MRANRLKNTPKQRHFSVQDSVVFFAPGAINPILPLFVEAPTSSTTSDASPVNCETVLEDLSNYSTTAKEGAVVGKVTHKSTGKNEVEITVNAFQVKGKADGVDKDEL